MIRTLKSGASAIPENDVLQFVTDMLASAGVFDNSGTQFQVSAGTGLAVNVAAGRAYLLAASGNAYPTINDATASVTIGTNSSGNPRIDAIVLYANLTASVNSDASNVAALMDVQGTPAGSPSAPSASAIQSAVGSGNPYIILAYVNVASGASAPGTITDMRARTVFLWQQLGTPYKFSAYLSANVGIANTTVTAVICDTKIVDTNNNYNTSTGIYTAPITGFYRYFLKTTIDGGAGAGPRSSGLYKGSTSSLITSSESVLNDPSGALNSSVVDLGTVSLTVGDQIGLYGYEQSGGSANIVGGGTQGTHWGLELISLV